jgi:hypothetical protein
LQIWAFQDPGTGKATFLKKIEIQIEVEFLICFPSSFNTSSHFLLSFFLFKTAKAQSKQQNQICGVLV